MACSSNTFNAKNYDEMLLKGMTVPKLDTLQDASQLSGWLVKLLQPISSESRDPEGTHAWLLEATNADVSSQALYDTAFAKMEHSGDAYTIMDSQLALKV